MPRQIDLKSDIQTALARFAQGKLSANTLELFAALGYRSDKQVGLSEPTASGFMADLGDERFNRANALVPEWRAVDLVMQLTETELNQSAQQRLFDARAIELDNYDSYLVFCLELGQRSYSRTELARVTREINKMVMMPALILFKHGSTLTLAVIDRRLGKRDPSKDVLEKVTLIKDIRFANPHRAHIEILSDLALPSLIQEYHPRNFAEFHEAWRTVLDTSELNKKFFRELANWFYWAKKHVTFPDGAGKNEDERNARALIRLLTRLIFVWFVKEKDWVPEVLFDEAQVKELLKDGASDKSSSYYQAVLQNLFFATLNTPMNRDERDSREFRNEKHRGRTDDYLVPNKYRYAALLEDPEGFLEICANIPFLNGGLFQSLDRELEQEELNDNELVALAAKEGKQLVLRVDGFSERTDNPLKVPNFLFFSAEKKADLNKDFGTASKDYSVRGLIHILNRYKFTVDENTPIEQEIALDPELLGKVFENLLAAYNPETGVTARKQTGSFYTPREIVNYMVDESLIAYLETRLSGEGTTHELSLQERLRQLVSYSPDPPEFDAAETRALVNAIDEVKILDPACGSGAFPMGMLHKLVHLLAKLDPNNQLWKAKQIATAKELQPPEVQESALRQIEESFARTEATNYARKLYLIQNCIYGVDIQPIAVQIAKLRCFISLVVDERTRENEPNRGVLPLPNLDTKFVAANALLGLEQPKQASMSDYLVKPLREQLEQSRHESFGDRTYAKKKKRRDQDSRLRREIAAMLKKDGWGASTAEQLAGWDPYDQNTHADFFDPEWMFGVENGFDVVIGNPPYGAMIPVEQLKLIFVRTQDTDNKNSAALFADIAKNGFTKPHGIVAFIVPKSLLYSEIWFALVQALLPHTLHLVDVEQAFDNVLLEQVVYIYSKSRTEENYVARKFLKGEFSIETQIPKSTVERFQAWVCGVTFEELEIGLKMSSSGKFMRDATTSKRGLPLQGHLSTTGHYQIIGGKNILRYGIAGIKGYAKRGEFDKAHKKISLLLHPKVISQQIVAHVQNPIPHIMIIASVDSDGSVMGLDTVENTFINENANLHLNFVAALFNSKSVNWYAYKFIFCSAIRTMHFDENYVGKIPIPSGVIEQPELQSPIIKLVDRILTAKRADPDADTTALEREIDRLVYQLYGLTEDEIKIVEGNTG